MNRSQTSDDLEQQLQLAERAIAHRELAARQARDQLASAQRTHREVERGLRDELADTRAERDRINAENAQLADELARTRNLLRQRLSARVAHRGIVAVDRVGRAVRRQLRP